MPTPTYTDAEILAEARAAMVAILSGSQSYSIAGRSMTKADLATIQNIIDIYEARVDASEGCNGIGGGTLLVKYRDAR